MWCAGGGWRVVEGGRWKADAQRTDGDLKERQGRAQRSGDSLLCRLSSHPSHLPPPHSITVHLLRPSLPLSVSNTLSVSSRAGDLPADCSPASLPACLTTPSPTMRSSSPLLRLSLLLLLVLLSLHLRPTVSIQFYLEDGQERCVRSATSALPTPVLPLSPSPDVPRLTSSPCA